MCQCITPRPRSAGANRDLTHRYETHQRHVIRSPPLLTFGGARMGAHSFSVRTCFYIYAASAACVGTVEVDLQPPGTDSIDDPDSARPNEAGCRPGGAGRVV